MKSKALQKGGEKMQEANEMRDRLTNEFAANYMEKLFTSA